MSLNNNRRCTTPIIRDDEGALSGCCDKLQGGVRRPSVPEAVVAVQNENVPTFWTDENFEPHLDFDGAFIFIDNI